MQKFIINAELIGYRSYEITHQQETCGELKTLLIT